MMRGFIFTFGTRFFARYFNKMSRKNSIERSPGLAFFEPLFGHHLLIAAVVIYDHLDQFTTILNSGSKSEFRKLFVRKRFPFVSTHYKLGETYKTISYKIAWARSSEGYVISVQNNRTRDERGICDVINLADHELIKTPTTSNNERIRALSALPNDEAMDASKILLFSIFHKKLHLLL